MKKTKVAKILLISVIALLILDSGSAALQGSGAPNTCQVSGAFHQNLVSAVIGPSITLVSINAGGTNETIVTGTFRNNEYVDVYGVATATVTVNETYNEKLSSNRTLVPAQGTTEITITFNDLAFQRYYSCLMTFTPDPFATPIQSGTNPRATVPASSANGTNYSSIGIAIISITLIAVGAVTGFMMFKKMRFSEQKLKRFTSSEYQNWILQRLGGHASSGLDARKGIDGFTGTNVPIMIKQSDNIGKLQVQNFMNSIIQARARNGIIVAFGFDGEAQAACDRARMNRIEIKLATIKELIERKETALL